MLRPASLAARLESWLSRRCSFIRLFALRLLRARSRKAASKTRKAATPAPMLIPLITVRGSDLLGRGAAVLVLVEGGLVDDGSEAVVAAAFMFVGSANSGTSSLRYITVMG
jgi:hypothetical protein